MPHFPSLSLSIFLTFQLIPFLNFSSIRWVLIENIKFQSSVQFTLVSLLLSLFSHISFYTSFLSHFILYLFSNFTFCHILFYTSFFSQFIYTFVTNLFLSTLSFFYNLFYTFFLSYFILHFLSFFTFWNISFYTFFYTYYFCLIFFLYFLKHLVLQSLSTGLPRHRSSITNKLFLFIINCLDDSLRTF